MRSDLGSRLIQGLFGGLLVLLGVALLTDTIGLADLGAYWRYWPLCLVAIGIGRWVNPDRADSDGFWFVFLGLLFLAHNLHLLRLGQSWPLFLVAIGAGVAWRALRRPAPAAIDEVGHDS